MILMLDGGRRTTNRQAKIGGDLPTDLPFIHSPTMLDVSWGETFVLFGLGVALIGRNDLPAASRMLGRQVGRVVDVLQGARARADRFTTDNDLRQLQNELRSSLRELDTVRGELAVAASGSGLMGKGLGTMVPGANRISSGGGESSLNRGASIYSGNGPNIGLPNTGTGSGVAIASSDSPTGHDYLAAAQSAEATASNSGAPGEQLGGTSPLGLAPRSQSVAAVAEEEWSKQGIGFVSRAERGTGAWEGMVGSDRGSDTGGSSMSRQATAGGAVLLADVIQQSLIFDQHDRAVREQEEALAQRAERIRQEKLQKK